MKFWLVVRIIIFAFIMAVAMYILSIVDYIKEIYYKIFDR
jgi:hypothetical protein